MTPEIQRAVAAERERLIAEIEGKVLPVLETCRRLFGGQGMHGPGALEDDCAFAIRVIQRLRQRAPEAPPPPVSPFDKIGADRLADEVAALVRRGIVRTRTPVTDALEDYRDPPSSPRADRLAALEASLAEVRALLKPLWPLEKWTVWKRGYGVAVLLDATGAAPNEEEWGEIETAINALPALRRLVEALA